jgi:hypothetical protein
MTSHWLLQNNLYSEEGFEHLTTALDRQSIKYSIHKCLPFIGTLDPEPVVEPGSRVIVMGSYTLANHAKAHGWEPGAWLENLDFEIQREHWGGWMLNCDSRVLRFDQIQGLLNPVFIRPVHDTKSFNGQVFDHASWSEFQGRVLALTPEDNAQVTGATLVQACAVKEIWSETRFWIVDGEVVTASGYKLGSRKTYSEVLGSRFSDDMIAFACDRAAEWSPNRAYVMDIAEGPYGYRIIEVNNLNSAGFYKANMGKLVHALETMDG